MSEGHDDVAATGADMKGVRAAGAQQPPLKWIPWKALQSLERIQFLRVSYIVLVGVPLLAAIQQTAIGSFFQQLPLTLRLGYFASLLLSLAHMIYQGFCPPLIKRFESPNDLYRDLLQIKALQVQYLPADAGFVFHIAHCRESFTDRNLANWGARLACALLYGSGVALVAWVVLERSLIVLGIG